MTNKFKYRKYLEFSHCYYVIGHNHLQTVFKIQFQYSRLSLISICVIKFTHFFSISLVCDKQIIGTSVTFVHEKYNILSKF